MLAAARTCALALTALVVLSGPTTAQTTADAAKKWGLIGTWSLDCAQPASRANGHLTYAVKEQGKVSHDRDFGNAKDVNEVEKATIKPDGSIEVVVKFPQMLQARVFTLMKGPDGRARAMSNSKVDGSDVTIRGGKFVFNGNETPWQTRCR